VSGCARRTPRLFFVPSLRRVHLLLARDEGSVFRVGRSSRWVSTATCGSARISWGRQALASPGVSGANANPASQPSGPRTSPMAGTAADGCSHTGRSPMTCWRSWARQQITYRQCIDGESGIHRHTPPVLALITTGRLGQGSPRTLGGWDRSRRGDRRRSTFPPASRLVSGNPVPKFHEGPDWLRRKSGEPLGKPSQLQDPLIHAGLGGLPPAGVRRGPEVSGRWEASDRGWAARRTSRHR
jgi:hypothetical protein